MPILAAMLLAACGTKQEVVKEEDTSQKEVNQVSSTAEDVGEEGSGNENKEEKQKLTKIGEMIDDPEEGTFTLENMKQVNQDIVQGGITIHIDEVKVITVSNMTSDYKEMLEQNAGITQDSPVTYLQVHYSFENTLDEPLDWSGFKTAIKEDGEQIDLDTVDILGMQNPSQTEIQRKATVKDNLIGIPVDKDIKSIRLVSDDVLKQSNESEDFIVHGKETTINLD